MNIIEEAKIEAKALLREAEIEEDIDLEVPENPEHGDLSFSCFKLAQKLKKDPKIVAKELEERILKKHPELK